MINEIDQYLKRLFSITRSITGHGNRETLGILQEIVPLNIKEYKSGEKVYDWTIPAEWHPKNAWIKDSDGNIIIDFNLCNIHLVGYSHSVKKRLSFAELKHHLHVHPTLAEAIPYRTSYYKKDWGFCVTQAQYNLLSNHEEKLEVLIDADFDDNGSLSVGELIIQGTSSKEILISTYLCHPSLANDNLSGLLLSAFLARELLRAPKPQYTYRFVWVPETIGAIAYCFNNEVEMKKIGTGLVITTVGGPGKFGYKQSIDTRHPINKIIEEVFSEKNIDYIKYPFDINGSDERQYSSQGFGINIATITKDKYYEYDYYHSSLDDLKFVKAKFILASLVLYKQVISKLDKEIYFLNKYPHCEVMLSKHALYPQVGGARLPDYLKYDELDIMKWLLLLSDGKNSISQISDRLKVPEEILFRISEKLISKKIFERF